MHSLALSKPPLPYRHASQESELLSENVVETEKASGNHHNDIKGLFTYADIAIKA